MKLRLFVIIIISVFPLFLLADSYILKVNIIQNETFVKAPISKTKVARIISEQLKVNGHDVVSDNKSADLYLDVFFYQQIGSQFISALSVIRSTKGAHYVELLDQKFGLDRTEGASKLIVKIARSIPKDVNRDISYELFYSKLFSAPGTLNLNTAITREVMAGVVTSRSFRSNYPDLGLNPMYVDMPSFLENIMYLSGLRSKIRRKGPLTLTFKISEDGVTSLKSIDAPFKLKENQEKRLKKSIEAFPNWLNDESIDNLEIKVL